MKSTSKEVLEAVSKHCANQLTFYKFNISTLKVSDKYRKGRLTALEYIGELTWYYLQEEKKIQQEFHEQVLKQMQQNSCLNDSEYTVSAVRAALFSVAALKVATRDKEGEGVKNDLFLGFPGCQVESLHT